MTDAIVDRLAEESSGRTGQERAMKRITIDYILSLEPCYNREELEELFRGRKWVAPRTICEEADPVDTMWLALRAGFFTKKQLRLLACDFKEHVQNNDMVDGEFMVADWPDDWMDNPDWVAFETAECVARTVWAAEKYARHARIFTKVARAMAAEKEWQVKRILEKLDRRER